MPRRTTLCAIPAALILAALTPRAVAQSPGARGAAMGGTGVASAHPCDAAFVNPALTRFRAEAWGLSIVAPFVVVTARDESKLIDAVDEFQTTLDDLEARLDAGDPSAATLRPFVASQLAGLNGRALDVGADAGLAVLIPMTDYTLTFSARSAVDARALPFIETADITTITDPTSTSADLENLSSVAVVAAAQVSEFGVTTAFEGALDGRRVSIGVTPKLQWIETYNYGVGVSEFDESTAVDDFRDPAFRSRRSDFNVDVGVAVELEPGAVAGLAIRNLIRDDYRTVTTLGRTFTYAIEPLPTLGIAVERVGFSFSADVDVRKTSRFQEVAESQFVRMGFEYDLLGWAQLRTGFSHDLRSTQQGLFSVGVGVSPVETVRFDLVGVLGSDALGAGLQLTLTL